MAMLYLTRHGQTELNWAGRMQGRIDSNLTERGKEQAERVGEKLYAQLGKQRVTLWVSPLGRAQQTAAIIARHIQVTEQKTDARLAEVSLGDWEGMTMEDIEFTHPGALDGSSRFDWAYRAPGGETEAALLDRLQDWLTGFERRNTPAVVVSHGWAGMALRALYSSRSFEDVSAKGDSHEAVFEFSDDGIREF
ncbi:MAG: histidine phosphatase family protein [Pseudomonadota bacterium]